MQIGILIGVFSGAILGIILLIVGGVSFLSARKKGGKCKWSPWVALAGVCALVTAGVNALCFL